MTRAPTPADEAARLKALTRYQILETPPEQVFDDLVNLAAQICGTPVSLVSLVDTDRQWFKSRVGLAVSETPRDVSFCAHAILKPDEILVVPDASLDERFATNPLVTDEPKIRFYAGAPLTTKEGHVLGTLCVVDYRPRQLTPEQISALSILRHQVVRELELRRYAAELSRTITQWDQAEKARKEQELMLRDLVEHSCDLIQRVSPHGKLKYVNRAWRETLGYSDTEIAALEVWDIIHPDSRAHCAQAFQRVMAGETIRNLETVFVAKDGREIPVEGSVNCLFDQGKPVATRGIFRDITERRRLRLLESILPVCSVCGKVRDDAGAEHGRGQWRPLEEYVSRHSEAKFSHGFCPDCYHAYRLQQGLPPEPPK